MPWQSVPPLIIIAGAFNVAAGLIWGVQRLSYGEDRKIGLDQWKFALENRDKRIQEYQTLLQQQKKE